MQEILDNKPPPQPARLSDAQLVGLLAHSSRLSLGLNALLQEEINRRNLSPAQIQTIQIDLERQEPIEPPFSFLDRNLKLLIGLLILLLLVVHFFVGLSGLIFLGVTYRANKRGVMLHSSARKTTWKRVEYLLLGIIILLYAFLLF